MTDANFGGPGSFFHQFRRGRITTVPVLIGAVLCLELLLPVLSRAQSGVGSSCGTNSDCAANNCVDGVCCDPSCFGTCRSCALAKTGQADGTCVQVSNGQQTTNGCTAAGEACSGGACVPVHCFNTVKDADETDVDCGGSCLGCGVGNTCTANGDCLVSNCIDGICCDPLCFGTCRSCALAKTGHANGTCSSVLDGQQTTSGCSAAGEACGSGGCVPVHCFNTVKDGDETDVDCGGSCAGCGVGTTCTMNSDCSVGNCIDGICCDRSCFGTCRSCASATTGQANGTCGAVLNGQQTTNGCNAAAEACSNGACVPTHCFNLSKDGDETDVDCGGSCSGCGVAKTCSTNSDCAIGNCVDGICCERTCFGTCHSCALATTGQPNGTCAQVLTGQPSTSGCSAVGDVCDDLGNCIGPMSGTATPTATIEAPTETATASATATLNASPTPTDTPQTPAPTPTDTPPATATNTPMATDAPTNTPSTTPAPSATASGTPTNTPIVCIGDCDQMGTVMVDELVRGLRIALATSTLDECRVFACNGDGQVAVDCILQAVNAALTDCHSTP